MATESNISLEEHGATSVLDTSDRAVVVSITIEKTPAEVWADVRDIASHVTWMQDAVEIRFLTDQTEGVGTRFECDTKVGSLGLTDVKEITSWVNEQRMGVQHVGLVEGIGEFTLTAIAPDRTEFRWEEDLSFPWWMGGPFGAFVARPVLKFIWKRNLLRLKGRLEAS
ncbi:MAG: SRPBCC family protein [Actinomycetota bacterium]